MPEDDIVFMREDFYLCTRVRHHQQKLVLFLSAMRHFANSLRDRKVAVHYETLASDNRDYFAALESQIGQMGAKRVSCPEPADCFFLEPLRQTVERAGAELVLTPNPGFLTSQADWLEYAKGTQRRLMADFYMWQRRRLGLLLDPKGRPVGGRRSFDDENRLKLPASVFVPTIKWNHPDPITQEVIQLVQSEFPSHPGRADQFAYPVTHGEAKEWLDQFLEERLAQFGPYEDALPQATSTVFHGLLTPMLNLGLLTPRQVLEATLNHASQNEIPLPSLEGFVRQLVGWREFIRGVDRESPSSRNALPPNTFGFVRKLAPAWYEGTTGLPPLDLAIRRALERGWCHHIERLMVLGNAMLLCEIAPQAAYQWFMEMFVDSADWVMGPNVYGMSQFADGPQGFATKPYISGSAYILKMSDFPKGPWCEIWDGLYWRFLDRQQDRLASNPRMRTALLGLNRLEPERKARIFRAAESFIDRVTLT